MLLQSDPQTLLIVFGSILLSMSFHEAMHAFAGHWLGDPTARQQGRLTLNPFKHIDLYLTVILPVVLIALGIPPFFVAKPVPFNPEMVKYGEFGAAIVGLVGPLTNLLLAVLASIILRLGSLDGIWLDAGFIFVIVNIGFFVFNMIPFPPLDGSRLLYAFAPEPLQKLMYQIESMGFTSIIIFMLILFPLLSGRIAATVQQLTNVLLGV